MNPEIDLESADVLEVDSHAYTDKSGNAREARSVMFKYGGKIFKLPLDKKAEFSRLKSKENKKGTITVGMSTFGDSISPDFRVTDIS